MVTGLYAAILTMIYVAKAFYVIAFRIKNKVSIGDGGHEEMARRMRVHGNLAEYLPLFLLLLLMLEAQSTDVMVLHALGAAFVFGRLVYPVAILEKGPWWLRSIGMFITLFCLLMSAIILLINFAFAYLPV